MSSQTAFRDTIADAIGSRDLEDAASAPGARDFPLMPVGEACDMGQDETGRPLIDPRLFDSAEFARNPHPYYRIMREHYPVFWDQLHNCYYITRYDDLEAICFEDELFATTPKGIASTVLGNTQLELSGLEHRRRRNLFGPHLVGKTLRNRLHAIERIAKELIEDWPSHAGTAVIDENGVRSVEIGKAFANEFPVRVVCDVLGFPKEAQSDFFYWYNTMMSGFGGSATQKQGLEARQDLEDYVSTLVEERRSTPTYLYDKEGNPVSKDIISSLCQEVVDGDYLSSEEITSNIALIVGGGGETTRGAIMNMWYLLLQHPDQLQAVLADEDLWDAAFHETLRMAIPTGGLQPRHTTRDVVMHGVRIPAGSLVHLVNHAGNRDETKFAEPDAFNIHRTDLYSGKLIRSGYNAQGKHSHMAFGVGSHMCPGAWISHLEATAGSRILGRHMTNPRLNETRNKRDPQNPDNFAPIGGLALQELWIDFDLPDA
ncbi:MAG: cytochrome P450 [Alphaproteobacteria bacterium]|nr:cytochrome P450 [Alphaproteobacteria bacterium]